MTTPLPVDEFPLTTEKQILKAVADEEKHFCSQEQMVDAFRAFKVAAEEYESDPLLDKLFDRICSTSNVNNVHSLKTIARWFEQRHTEFFVELEYGTESYEATEMVEQTHWGFRTGRTEPTTVRKHREILTGVAHTVVPPYEVLTCTYVPKTKNLSHWRVECVLFFSKRTLVVFYSFNRLQDRTWDSQIVSEDVKWSYHTLEMCDVEGVKGDIVSRLKRYEGELVAYLSTQYCIVKEKTS